MHTHTLRKKQAADIIGEEIELEPPLFTAKSSKFSWKTACSLYANGQVNWPSKWLGKFSACFGRAALQKPTVCNDKQIERRVFYIALTRHDYVAPGCDFAGARAQTGARICRTRRVEKNKTCPCRKQTCSFVRFCPKLYQATQGAKLAAIKVPFFTGSPRLRKATPNACKSVHCTACTLRSSCSQACIARPTVLPSGHNPRLSNWTCSAR